MYIPNVGARVKLKLFERHWTYGIHAWAWLKVLAAGEFATQVEVLNGNEPTGDVLLVLTKDIDPPLGWREVKPGEYLFTIAPEKVEMVRDWFKNRGGVLRWTNKDLGNCGAPDKITPALPDPGETKQAPGWAYVGDSFPVKPEEIGVRTETAVVLPPEWFPVCDRCDGTGKVSVASLAKVRKQTQKATLAALKSDGRTLLVDAKNIKCWCCDGTGHKERRIQVRVKKAPWIGYDLFDAGKEKARKIAKKLGPDVKWDFEFVGYGLAQLRFYREKIEPFTL
jgi:hypothetical protein